MTEPDPPPVGPADDSTATLKPQRRLPQAIGEYHIVRKIGEGGMGVVYEAEQQHPKRAVALKVIRGGAYVDDQSVRLFHREAQALARLKHAGMLNTLLFKAAPAISWTRCSSPARRRRPRKRIARRADYHRFHGKLLMMV